MLKKTVLIEPDDWNRIVDELEHLAASDDFVGLRTRAFIYLLSDGVLKPKTVLSLNAEEVAQDPSAKRIRVVEKAVQRPCEANQYHGRTFVMTDRARKAIAEYLEAARREGWFPHGDLKGPLWIATEHRGTLQRLAQRSANAAWRRFLDEINVGHDYQLEDVVFTGRVEVLEAAKGNIDVLAEYTGISRSTAALYRVHMLESPTTSTREVLSKLNKRQTRKPS